jgi:hypothetical protein
MFAAGFVLVGAVSASAAPRYHIAVVPHVHTYGSFVYNPYWGPWYP